MTDLALLQRFTNAITGADVTLPSPQGGVTVPKAVFQEAINELTGLEQLVGAEDFAQQVVANLQQLVEWCEDGDTEPSLAQLQTCLGAEEDDESEHDPGLIDLVTGALQQIGVQADGQTGAALLDIISGYVEQHSAQPQPGRHRAPEPSFVPVEQDWPDTEYDEYEDEEPAAVAPARFTAPVQIQQGPPPMRPPVRRRNGVAAAPVAQAPRPRPNPALRAAPLHPGGRPIPANPPPFVPVPAEQVLGLRRGRNGRYDAGDIGE